MKDNKKKTTHSSSFWPPLVILAGLSFPTLLSYFPENY